MNPFHPASISTLLGGSEHPRDIPRNPGVSEAIEQFKCAAHTPDSSERIEFCHDYEELVACYEKRLEGIFKAAKKTSEELVTEAKLPDIRNSAGDGLNAGRGSSANAGEEEALQEEVRRKFVEGVLRLQSLPMPKKRRGSLPPKAVNAYRAWFNDHIDHPYPSDEEKLKLSKKTGTTVNQVTNWFINYRKRVWRRDGNDINASTQKASSPDEH